MTGAARQLRGLYAVSHTGPPDLSTVSQIAAALAGGARLVQYRDKSLDPERRQQEATELLALCRGYKVPLLINDDIELAAAIGADGVHLGRDDASITDARDSLGPNAIIGASCYNELELAVAAQAEGSSYIAFGSFFPSASKPQAVPASLDLLRAARQVIQLPIIAIGGITPENGGPLIRAGADMLAVITALFQQADIRLAARQFKALFDAEEDVLP